MADAAHEAYREPRLPCFHRSMFLYSSCTGNICAMSHDKKER
jgi:hypothetical protein